MINIQDIRVYDPKSDGIDFRTYKKAFYSAYRVNHELAYALHRGLIERVEDSRINEEGTTLRQFLDKFFSRQHGFVGVLFMDGRLDSQYYNRNRFPDIEALSEEANAIPFMFTHDEAVDQWLREREATEAVRRSERRRKND